jgi:hypothetical protein
VSQSLSVGRADGPVRRRILWMMCRYQWQPAKIWLCCVVVIRIVGADGCHGPPEVVEMLGISGDDDRVGGDMEHGQEPSAIS